MFVNELGNSVLKGILVCQVCYKTKQNKTKQKKNKKTKQTNKKTPKNHRLGDLNNRDFFLTVLETESPRSCYSQDWFLLRPFSLACTQDPSHSVLKWPFSCAFVFSVSLLKSYIQELVPSELMQNSVTAQIQLPGLRVVLR